MSGESKNFSIQQYNLQICNCLKLVCKDSQSEPWKSEDDSSFKNQTLIFFLSTAVGKRKGTQHSKPSDFWMENMIQEARWRHKTWGRFCLQFAVFLTYSSAQQYSAHLNTISIKPCTKTWLVSATDWRRNTTLAKRTWIFGLSFSTIKRISMRIYISGVSLGQCISQPQSLRPSVSNFKTIICMCCLSVAFNDLNPL